MKKPRTSATNPFDTTPVAPAPAKASTPEINNISLERCWNSQLEPKNLMSKIDGTRPVAQPAEDFWVCICGNQWQLSKNHCSKPCFKWRKDAHINAKLGLNKNHNEGEKRSLLKTRRSSKRSAGNPFTRRKSINSSQVNAEVAH